MNTVSSHIKSNKVADFSKIIIIVKLQQKLDYLRKTSWFSTFIWFLYTQCWIFYFSIVIKYYCVVFVYRRNCWGFSGSWFNSW